MMTLTVVLVLALAVKSSRTWSITSATPPRLSHATGGNTSYVMQADEPIRVCQCRTYYKEQVHEALLDLSLGRQSAVSRSDKYSARYWGRGLDQGHCGVQLSGITFKYRVLVCRARTGVGDWQYRQVALVWVGYAQFPLTARPQHVVLPGNAAELPLCRADRRLWLCRIELPGEYNEIDFTETSRAQGAYTYHGRGLASGECGVRFDVGEKDNGPVTCWARNSGNLDSVVYTMLIVAAPPSSVNLSLSSGAVLTSGSSLTATCIVSASRPAPSITWLLGDRIIRQDRVSDGSAADAWWWPWDKQEMTQTLRHAVVQEDDGERLKCRVEHVALKERLQQAVKMIVKAAHCFWDAPRRQMHDVALYRVAVGNVLRGWHEKEVGVQQKAVEDVQVHDNYVYHTATQQHDIAVVTLTSAVRLTDTVNVACVDWDNTLEGQQLRQGQSGIVAGWGFTLAGSTAREHLQWTSLPWISDKTCRDSIKQQQQQKVVGYDKFCAGYVNKSTSVCVGDSGGGLMFLHEDRFYLRGIVSISLAPVQYINTLECYAETYAAFTKVSAYLQMLNAYKT